MYTQHGKQRQQERGINELYTAYASKVSMKHSRTIAVFFESTATYVVANNGKVITTYVIEPYGESNFNALRKARNKAERNGDKFIIVR